jgi:aspartate aminotransferase-like enzyme
MIRVNHYGPEATPEAVRASLEALGAALTGAGARRVDVPAAVGAARAAWA